MKVLGKDKQQANAIFYVEIEILFKFIFLMLYSRTGSKAKQ